MVRLGRLCPWPPDRHRPWPRRESALPSPGACTPSFHRPCGPAGAAGAALPLVTNLRWSWHPETRDLFEALDPELWRTATATRSRCWARSRPSGWPRWPRTASSCAGCRTSSTTCGVPDRRPLVPVAGGRGPGESIAYFSAEFGITEVLPQYSGGLGILAGDHLKAASDLGVPLIGVGLLYRAGYFAQGCPPTAGSWSTTRRSTRTACRSSCCATPTAPPRHLACRCPRAAPCTRTSGGCRSAGCRCCCSTATSRRTRRPSAAVTDRLYGGDEDHRLRQEMLLGIGGVRALRAYCAADRHPAARGLPRQRGPRRLPGRRADPRADRDARPDVRRGLQAVRAGTVFTTHTPVPAGIDRFPKALIERYFAGFGVPLDAAPRRWAPRRTRQVQHGAHGPAARPAGQRREPAARRGQPRHVLRPVAGLRRAAKCRSPRSPTACTRRPGRRASWSRWAPSRRARGTRLAAATARALRRRGQDRGRRPVGHPADAARPAGRRGAPPAARDGLSRGRHRGRARLDRRPPSTPTCSPSASPAACRRTSG